MADPSDALPELSKSEPAAWGRGRGLAPTHRVRITNLWFLPGWWERGQRVNAVSVWRKLSHPGPESICLTEQEGLTSLKTLCFCYLLSFWI